MTAYDPVSGNPAVQFVGEAHHKFGERADSTYDLALSQLGVLGAFTETPTEFNIDFNFTDQLTPFERPVAPVLDNSGFDLRPTPDIGAPTDFDAQTPDIGPAPTFTDLPPSLVFGDVPDRPVVAVPVAPPRPTPLVVPTAPGYVMPQVPTRREIVLPTLQAITLPLFAGVRPEFVEPVFDSSWTFSPAAYVSALLDKVSGKLTSMLDGQDVLPDAIKRAIFDQGRARIQLETQADIDQTYDEFAARGFSSPPGMLAARVDERRQKAQAAMAEANRDLTIKAFEESLANYRLAITQGIQLEGVKISLHVEEQKLLLESAKFLRESAIALLNARLSVFNAKMQGYETDARVLGELIRAELSKLEVFKAQLDGQRLIGEINAQDVALYNAQLQGLNTIAEFYRTQVEGVKAQADVQRLVFEAFKAEVEAFDAQWGAYGKEIDGYRASIEAQGSKAQMFNTLTNAFGTRMQAYSTEQGAKIDREKLRIAEHGQKLSTYLAGLQHVEALLSTERARLAAVGQKADAQARLYAAAASVEQSATAATDRSYELGLQRERADIDSQIESVKIRSAENIQVGGLLLEVRKAMAQIMAQLAASTMSAVSYGANVSSGLSSSLGYSKSFGYSGDTDDANPNF